MKPPAFQFYADDFLAGVADMTQAEVGAYILLLCHQWGRGKIPPDGERVALVAKGPVTPHVLEKFPGGQNERLEAERAKQEEWREQQRAKGQASARARMNHGSTTVQPRFNHGSTTVQPDTQPEPNSPSPSPSPNLLSAHTARARAEIPTWDEVKALASMRAVPEASAKSFFDHHEGNGLWLNQFGKLINWQHKLTTWAASDRQNPKANGHNGAKLTGTMCQPHELKLKRLV